MVLHCWEYRAVNLGNFVSVLVLCRAYRRESEPESGLDWRGELITSMRPSSDTFNIHPLSGDPSRLIQGLRDGTFIDIEAWHT